MNLIPWKSRNKEDDYFGMAPVSQFRGELDRLFDRFFRDPWGEGDAVTGWSPTLDVTDTEKEVVIRADVPGVDPKDLNLTVTGNLLTISGEKKEQTEKKGENYYHAERRFGSFRRTVQLPAGVDADKVTAEHKNGVVTIHLKKTPGATPRRIAVQSA